MLRFVSFSLCRAAPSRAPDASWLGGLAPALRRATLIAAVGAALSGCLALDDVAQTPQLSSTIKSEMARKGTTPESPVLVRIFKQESELEIWKADKSGNFALFKTYPMCRWSGKLGPKTKIGDRQAPEGFYAVSASQLNPKSQYYVSFNLGYPNRLEQALGYTGEALMVHGACSSSGCYAMTDKGIGEIYAIVAKALDSGQPSFQVQAYPFRMTAQNMAAHKGDPNMPFWRTLKEGYDAFTITRRPPKVSACGGRYVFNRNFTAGEPDSPVASCPPSTDMLDATLSARLQTEESKVDAALAADLPASSTMSAYVDGGMHKSFRAILQQAGPKTMAAKVSGTKYPVSRPEAALADPFGQ